MITASLGSHRFESGPTYHYNAATVGSLTEVVFSPEQTTDYVNILQGVNATNEEVQQVAAAGIVRLAVGEPKPEFIPEATKMLLDVCRGDLDSVPRDIFRDPDSWDDDSYTVRGVLFNAFLDSASVLASRTNNAAETAGIIEAGFPSDEGYFVIGLANGGIISAAHTFLELSEGNNGLTFVRYSRYKSGDSEPNMNPYPDTRKDWLKRLAEGLQVVVYDEDHSSDKTLTTAVEYFAGLFDKNVFGIAPVQVERRITYNPLVVKSN